VARRVAVLLLDGGEDPRAGHDPAGGVHDVVGVELLGDEVGQSRRVLGVPEHDRVAPDPRPGVQAPRDPLRQGRGRRAHAARVGGDVLAQQRGDRQVGAPRVAAQREAHHRPHRLGLLVGPELETEGPPDDLARPRLVDHNALDARAGGRAPHPAPDQPRARVPPRHGRAAVDATRRGRKPPSG
jgi:hypothetical protein